MGIKGLKPLLKSFGIYEYTVPLTKMTGKTLAVDGTFMLHKYKNCHSAPWHYLVLYMLVSLKLRNVNAIFVFDGQPLPEKSREKMCRKSRKQAMVDKGELLKAQFREWETSKVAAPELEATVQRLSKTKCIEPTLDNKETATTVETYIGNLAKDTRVTGQDYQLFRQSLEAFGFPYMDAPDEAELCCVRMTEMGLVDGPLTIDSDAIACGAYHNVDTVYTDIYGDNLKAISVRHSTEALGLNGREFLDLCVMCGTDFNMRIHKLGPATALKLIKTFGSIENLPSNIQTECLAAVRTREILIGRDMEDRRKEIETLQNGPVSGEKIKQTFSSEMLNKLIQDNAHIRANLRLVAPGIFA
ncbi:putative DNA repair protein RAD2 [Largemouth bass virus]|uniref:DNA repair protein RAD2 n=1 Tax=Largemouth bass virus TaxID=176656 RepID=A0A9X7TTQ6_9VIRU|nr:hypothetical protein OA88_22665 [Flavobacterium sp. JRM]QJE49123.1 putative DNA repair protein RAD2 [Largemouth bass virus]QJE49209.1 putative DNA repair protein RAD2 [Largemouth bass virus]